MNQTVDIITRTKNRPTLLDRAIRTTVEQSFGDWKLIIVNDGGDPDTVEAVVQKFNPENQCRIKVIHNKVSLGRGGALNLGIRNGTSPLVVLLDDDDTWHPDFLISCTEVLARPPQIMGAVTQTIRVEEEIIGDRIVELNRFQNRPLLRSVSLGALLYTNIFTTNAFVYRRSAWEIVGPYREDLQVLEDWEYNIRFLRHFDVTVVPCPLAFYHTRRSKLGPESNSVVSLIDMFQQVKSSILNEYLRKDLDQGTTGIGILAAICQTVRSKEEVQKFSVFERLISKIGRLIKK